MRDGSSQTRFKTLNHQPNLHRSHPSHTYSHTTNGNDDSNKANDTYQCGQEGLGANCTFEASRDQLGQRPFNSRAAGYELMDTGWNHDG
jgi:hypothetical protein